MSEDKIHGPVRTCISCGRKGGKDDLLKLVMGPGGEIAADIRGKLPGRGANVCFDAECLRKAAKSGLARAYKGKARAYQPEELMGIVATGLRLSLYALLRQAKAAGKIASGISSVENAINKRLAKLLLIADDAGGDSAGKLARMQAEAELELIRLPDKQTLAEALDWQVTAVFAITDDRFAQAVRQIGERLNRIVSWK